MTVLLETPVPILVLGVLAGALLGWLYLTLGRKAYLIALGGVAAIVLLSVLVERLVVTEREQIEAVLDAGAAAVQANDVARAESLLSRGGMAKVAPKIHRYAALIEFEQVHIRNIQIEINDLVDPPTAYVTLDATAHFRHRLDGFPYSSYSGTVHLELVKEPSGWRVEDYIGPEAEGYRQAY